MASQLSPTVQARLVRLQRQLEFAWNAAPDGTATRWALSLPEIFATVTWRRGRNIIGLISTAGRETSRVALALYRAHQRGDLQEQVALELTDIGDTLRRKSKAAANTVEALYNAVVADPRGTAPQLITMVVSALVVSGGPDGDGGAPDLDLMLGIDAHRSIFSHSILMGATLETGLIAIVSLANQVHGYLPNDHDPAWDMLSAHLGQIGNSALRGMSVGLAYHLAFDGIVEPAAYKDLPVDDAPMAAHEGVILTNAAAEAVDASHKDVSVGRTKEQERARQQSIHSHFKSQPFFIPHRLKAKLSDEHVTALEKRGEWMRALASRIISPLDEAECAFVEAAWGRREPTSTDEFAWRAFVRLAGRYGTCSRGQPGRRPAESAA